MQKKHCIYFYRIWLQRSPCRWSCCQMTCSRCSGSRWGCSICADHSPCHWAALGAAPRPGSKGPPPRSKRPPSRGCHCFTSFTLEVTRPCQGQGEVRTEVKDRGWVRKWSGQDIGMANGPGPALTATPSWLSVERATGTACTRLHHHYWALIGPEPRYWPVIGPLQLHLCPANTVRVTGQEQH